ncbi:MAG: FtsX-like permease family protein [Acidobacteria bacterium]|nr:FtsX-like permease family protein [Acidobacteriota bacterium]
MTLRTAARPLDLNRMAEAGMRQLWMDLRYGLRHFRRSPGFTAVAVVSLVLGIAANTTIFSLINGLLLRPLSGRNPGEPATVYTSDYSGPLYSASSYPGFLDYRQRNEVFSGLAAYAVQPLLMTDPLAVLGSVREIAGALDSSLPLYGVTTLERYAATSLLPVRAAATLLGAMGTLALVLAAGGIYGVVSYAVSRRTREIGARMALGARTVNILRMVLGQGLGLAAAGVLIGAAAAAGLTRFAAFLLYGITPLDPWTFAGIPLLLVLAAVAASLVPAVRAMRVAPAVALRYE